MTPNNKITCPTNIHTCAKFYYDDVPEHMTKTVDLSIFSQEVTNKAIFTRETLELAKQKCYFANAGAEYLMAPDANGEMQVIWLAPDSVPQGEYTVNVGYLTYVEMSPQYRTLQYATDNVEALRGYNQDSDAPEELCNHPPCPFVLSWEEQHDMPPDALDQQELRRARTVVDNARSYWEVSKSRQKLITTLQHHAPHTKRITKLVCVGLGSLAEVKGEVKHEFPTLQHLTTFTIAQTLTELYRKDDPEAPSISIVAQDLNYNAVEEMVLSEAYSNITFAEDPDGFLAIDEGSLVVTSSLPFVVPLLQIVGDLTRDFGGPAGFLCDMLRLDRSKTDYCVMDREMPRVTAMVLPYSKLEFTHHQVEEDMEQALFPGIDYWPWESGLYLNKK